MVCIAGWLSTFFFGFGLIYMASNGAEARSKAELEYGYRDGYAACRTDLFGGL